MTEHADQPRQPLILPSRWLSGALATVVLVASLLLVLAYWRSAQLGGLRTAEQDFHASNQRIVGVLQQRLVNYELLARGGASLQASLPRPSRTQWQRYVAGLQLTERFAAVQALGFAIDLRPGQLGALQQVLPGIAFARPGDARELHALVLYVAPEVGANLRATGVDLATEPARREAMQQSAIDGRLRMSAPVRPIVADAGVRAEEMALFAPVYAGDAPEPGKAAIAGSRPLALRGWVFVQVRVHEFIDRALRGVDRDGAMRLVDVTGPSPQVAYLDPAFLGEQAMQLAEGRRPAFTQSLELEAMGRRWRLDFESAPVAQVNDELPGLQMTLLFGVAGSLLLFAIALVMVRTQAHARSMAERMSDSYRRSEQRFRSAMQYSAIGKALLDRDGRILHANPAMVQILGSSEQALEGSLLGQHFVDGEGEAMRTVERQALSEDGAYRVTRRLRRSDGEVRHASLTFSTVPGERGESFASLVQVEDVTERLRAEARVQALNRTLEARVALRTRELSHANQELEAFAYSVSHDLRAPLRSIDGFSRLLTERYRDAIDASGQDYLGRIRNASARMSDLIDALLKMSRVSRGELQVAQVDLSAMAKDIATELRNADPARSVAFDIQPGLLVSGDPALLRNLMDNLLGNAWKFTAHTKDARIAVGGDHSGEIFVRDNGAGFAPEYAAKLFRPFQRLHTADQYAGHGIGLASVKRIVERHGGSIRAEGQVGQGATFWFRLPEERGAGSED
jgi:PAS domain S-box-containing protein